MVRVDHGLSVEITHLVLERRGIVVFGHRIDTWLATPQLPMLGVLKGTVPCGLPTCPLGLKKVH